MRILLLTQWFDPEPTFKGLAFARALKARGHSVEVLTGFPNYPGGRLYEGFRLRVRRREEIEGIRVIRVALYPNHDGSGIKRAGNYLSFAASAALVGPVSVSRPDVVYVYHPPGTIGLPAAVLSLLKGCPYVYDVQDLWPDSVAASGMMSSQRLNRLLAWWCAQVYRRAAHVVVLSPGFRKILVERGVPEERVSVIYNWCDETALDNGGDPTRRADHFRVVFAGTMGKVQGLRSVLDAAARVQEVRHDVEFTFVGGGVEVDALKGAAAEMRLGNVQFLPRRPFSEIGRVLRDADALLVHLKDDPLFRITIPSKTQAYMRVGRPIVMGVKGDAADLVRRAGCGVVCEPENAESIAGGVLHLAAMPAGDRAAMGARGEEFYRDHLSLEKGVAAFEKVFERVTAA